MGKDLKRIPEKGNFWTYFGLLVLITAGIGLFMRLYQWSRQSFQKVPVHLPLNRTRQARLNIHHVNGELRVSANAFPDELMSGTFNGGVKTRTRGDADHREVKLTIPLLSFLDFIGPNFKNNDLDWIVALNPDVVLFLDLETGGGRTILDLRKLQVKDLWVKTTNSAVEIELPENCEEMRVEIQWEVAPVEVHIPETISACISINGNQTQAEVDTARFPQVRSHEYQSLDYERSDNRVDILIHPGIGEVRVR